MQKRWQFVSRQEEKAASATGVEVGDAYTLNKNGYYDSYQIA